MTFIITRGYPGSGKTTRALEWVNEDPTSRVRVNRDDLRQTLFGKVVGVDEKTVTIAQRAAVEALLKAGKDVIVDDTSLRLRDARQWADLAVKHGHKFEVWDVKTDLETCLQRNDARGYAGGRHVPPDVIRDFAKRYPFKNWQEVKPTERTHSSPPAKVEPNYLLPPAIIVDLDGTLAKNVTGREFYGEGLNHVYDDEVNHLLNNLIGDYHHEDKGYQLIFMSGRNEFAREDTVRWLKDKAGWLPDEYLLYMREDDDMRKDFMVKADLFDKHVRDQYNVLLCFDDRDQIVRLWRDMGLTCFQVADGSF